MVAAAVYGVFALLGRFHEIAMAVFLGLVVTAVLRTVADLAARFLPRPLAVAAALLGSILLVAGVLTLVGEAVAGERTTLVREFHAGEDRSPPRTGCAAADMAQALGSAGLPLEGRHHGGDDDAWTLPP